MSHTQHSRRDVLKLLGAAPFIASHAGAPATSVQPAVPPARAKLCLVSRHLQWTNMEEAVSVAAEAGCKAIAWTVRQGAHMLPANVERDLPKAVELAHIAGLVRLNEKYGTTAMYHTHSASGNIGGGVWDLWLAVRDFNPQFVGLNYDLGHATIRGGTGWIETSHIAHKFVHGLSVKDFRWVKSSGSATGSRGRRGGPPADRSSRPPWSPEMVPGGEGMVDFTGMLSYFKSVGFAGPVELYQEYHVNVAGVAEPVNMLGTDLGKWKREMPESQDVSLLKRDVTFYTNALTESGLL